jgi:hypothetical protein
MAVAVDRDLGILDRLAGTCVIEPAIILVHSRLDTRERRDSKIMISVEGGIRG